MIVPLLLLALVAGCNPAPTEPTTTSKNPTPKPSTAAATTPTPAASAGNGVPEVRTTYTGATVTFDGQPTTISDASDRVYFANSGLITIGALVGVMTLPVGEHQLQLSVNGNGRSPHTNGFTTAELKDIGWTLWVGDGKFIPNKYAPSGEPEIDEKAVENGILNMHYKGTLKHMISGDARPAEVTIKDFPLR